MTRRARGFRFSKPLIGVPGKVQETLRFPPGARGPMYSSRLSIAPRCRGVSEVSPESPRGTVEHNETIIGSNAEYQTPRLGEACEGPIVSPLTVSSTGYRVGFSPFKSARCAV